MSSLIEEYRRRHDIKCLWPANEGVLFFEAAGRPAAVCLTSSFSKCATSCNDCRNTSENIIIETFILQSYPIVIQTASHDHVWPETDLLEFVRRKLRDCFSAPLTAYVSKGERDQERWMWDFFVATDAFGRSSRFQAFCAKQIIKKTEPNEAMIEQAFWCIRNEPSIYRLFFDKVYAPCLVGRKYLLLN